jgi:hypothetical protein
VSYAEIKADRIYHECGRQAEKQTLFGQLVESPLLILWELGGKKIIHCPFCGKILPLSFSINAYSYIPKEQEATE